MNSKLLVFDLDDTLFLCSGVIKEDYSNLEEIKLFPGVKEFLITNNTKKFLVTKGDKEIQEKKVNLLGIKDDFEKIFFPLTDAHKITCFKKIIKQYPNNESWVIGNKITSEIKFGNELGLKTVILKKGKYKTLKAKDDSEVPDYEIEEFTELNEVLK
jgi:putative hydrolase of the HAD superfamily